ncbi:MAG: glucokinase [Alphaproteobacteria bacterium]
MRAPAVIADLGGTNIRFALAEDGQPVQIRRFRIADFASFGDALAHYLDRVGLADKGSRTPAAVAIAAAGPVRGREIAVTNNDWIVREADIKQLAPGAVVHLLNDFEAVADAIPGLTAADVAPVSAVLALLPPAAPAIAVGPGTGLGISAVIPDGEGGWRSYAGEGGHMTLAATDEAQAHVLAILRQQFGRVSLERVLSGPGLVNLWAALGAAETQRFDPYLSAGEVFDLARRGDLRACAAVDLFTEFLGAIAGDLALVFGATGGVFLAGGILPRWGETFAAERFLAAFYDKGPMTDYVRAIPVARLTLPDPALAGLARRV